MTKDPWADDREKKGLALENDKGKAAAKAAIAGRHLKGELRKIAEQTKKGK